MDHIIQLKKIRAEALARLRNSDDFKLAGKLGQLIVELGDRVDSVAVLDDMPATHSAQSVHFGKADIPPAPTLKSAFLAPVEPQYSDRKGDEMIDELVAEIEGDAAKLDALMAESGESGESGEGVESDEFGDSDESGESGEGGDGGDSELDDGFGASAFPAEPAEVAAVNATDAEHAAKQGLSNLSAFIESEKLQQSQFTNGAAR
ncbi:MAG: hypothetical protein GKR97_18130 [Rhizobiaceae bacterium]|nr:hypothetical protein [Rhizobiaceae bacterium]